MPTRISAAESFAAQHRRDTISYSNGVDTRKAAPQFDFASTGASRNANFFNLLSNTQTTDRAAYKLFRRWTYVAISAIARRMMGFEFCAGDVKKTSTQKSRGTKGVWYKRLDEPFARRELLPFEVEALPKFVRRMLGGTLKSPASAIEVLDSHPVLDLLQRPNHVQKKNEFIFNLVANLYLTGEAWIIGGVEQGSSEPVIWAVPSTWIEVRHEGKLFSSYYLRADSLGGVSMPVPEGGITRIYFPDPEDPTKVLSPVIANLEATQTDKSLQIAHKSSFDQGIFPKIAIQVGPNIDHTGKQLKTRPVLDAEQREQLMSAVMAVWMSSAGDGMPAVLDGLIDDIKILQTSPVEMDYLNSSKLIKERIFQAFSLNPIIVGEVTASNKAQALVAERNFKRQVLQPLADSISVALSEWLGPWYTTPKNLVIWLEQEELADEDLVVKKWQHAVDRNLVTEDEYRVQMLGLSPLEDEDRATDRSQMFNNPQALTVLQGTIQLVATGKLEYDAAVSQIMHFFEVDEEAAQAMLGTEPTEAEIEANTTLATMPPADGEQPPEDDEPADDGAADEAPADDGEEQDGSEVEADDEDAKRKKKALMISRRKR